MVRQYRIDRFNGLEVLVCEVYRKHLFTQAEIESFQAWKSDEEKRFPAVYSQDDFRVVVRDWFAAEHAPGESFFGLAEPIPVYDYLPAIVLRGAIVDNRIASLQVDYIASVISVEVVDAVQKFYSVLDSPYWRDIVSHQIERYGSLFEPEDD